MKIFMALMLGFFMLGCQTIRMKYESVVEVSGEPTKSKFTYVNSYPVGGAHASLCWLTGIAFGGSCWFYLAMPTVQQKAILVEDANDYLSKKYTGKKFEEDRIKVTKVGFVEGGEEAELTPKERPNSDNPPAP